MNHKNVARVLRADGAFNFLAGLALLFFYRPAFNLLGYVAGRVYRHSHDSVMREGEEGLRRYCARRAGV